MEEVEHLGPLDPSAHVCVRVTRQARQQRCGSGGGGGRTASARQRRAGQRDWAYACVSMSASQGVVAGAVASSVAICVGATGGPAQHAESRLGDRAQALALLKT